MGRLGAAILVWLGLAGSASAGEMFIGAYDHDATVGLGHGGHETGAQLTAGYRTDPIDTLAWAGRPSGYAFAATNTAGGTNYVGGGLSWRLERPGARFYVQPGLGLMIHDGHVDRRQRGTGLNLGSRLLLEPELALGWRFTERLALEGSLIHLSHARIAGARNPGLNELGLRLVYRF